MERKTKKRKDRGKLVFIMLLLFLEITFVLSLFLPLTPNVFAAIGDPVTVPVNLTVGNAYPEILNVTINNFNTITLNANATTEIEVLVIARDFNGEGDISNITTELFDTVASSFGDSDDNNHHYINNTCDIDTTYGDNLEVNATCSFFLWYYANNQTWNATSTVTDNSSATGLGSDLETINALLAVELPNRIDYGVVNATAVSEERRVNITNFGNVGINLTLEGYAVIQGDALAMNCSLGTSNISIDYEGYNLTSENVTIGLNLSDFVQSYHNLTNYSITRAFNLDHRQNDTGEYFDDTNTTYWRIYVPLGVGGVCSGNIIFGATQGTATV